MTPKRKPITTLSHEARDELKKLPGNIRAQLIKEIDKLETAPRPSNSKRLEMEDAEQEARRLRIGKWRIIYLVIDEAPIILAIRRRPPYNYEDLDKLIS